MVTGPKLWAQNQLLAVTVTAGEAGVPASLQPSPCPLSPALGTGCLWARLLEAGTVCEAYFGKCPC